jgi:hypothetical protein
MYFIGVSMLFNLYVTLRKRQLPLLVIFTGINLFIISRVPHKETRFILPVLPYMMMAGG